MELHVYILSTFAAMKLKEIHRTATFAWSPFGDIPLLATGTVAGALDESFSNDSQLEIWAPDFRDKSEYDLGGIEQKGPTGAISTTSRYFIATICVLRRLTVSKGSIASSGALLRAHEVKAS